MGNPHADPSVPRGLLLAIAGLLGLALAATAVARLTGIGTTPNPSSALVSRLDLRFADRPDGAVSVTTGGDGREIAVLEPGHHGFIRSVVRGLVRERRARGIGPGPPFELRRWADGRLSFDDPATGRTVELGAFGPDNAGAFAALLTAATVQP